MRIILGLVFFLSLAVILWGLTRDSVNRRKNRPDIHQAATQKEIEKYEVERIIEPIMYIFWLVAFLFLLDFFGIVAIG